MSASDAIAATPLPLHAADEIAAAIRTALHGLPEPFACSPAQLRQRDALTDALAGIARLRDWVDAASRLVAAQASIIQANAALSQKLADRADLAETKVATAIDDVLTLLFGVDESQSEFRPMTNAEVVETVRGLLDTLMDYDGGQVVTIESGMTPGNMETQP